MERYLIASFETYGREPILRKMNDGSLICLFLTGGKTEPDNENFTAVSRSVDGGKTWTKPEMLFNHRDRGVWSTEIFCDGKYPIIAVQTYNAASHYRELQTFASYSMDNGKTWSEPRSFCGAMNGCSIRQGFTLSNGDIMFPLYRQEVHKDFQWGDSYSWNNWPFVCGAGISEDCGDTWQTYGYIHADTTLWEPNAVEVEPGQIIMYCRSGKECLYISESFDYGRSWSDAVPSDIRNPGSKVTCIKVSGKILMINNDVSVFADTGFSARTHLSISISEDGKSFNKICYVDDKNKPFFYPHAFADEQEKILYIAYENSKTHYLAKFSFNELGL